MKARVVQHERKISKYNKARLKKIVDNYEIRAEKMAMYLASLSEKMWEMLFSSNSKKENMRVLLSSCSLSILFYIKSFFLTCINNKHSLLNKMNRVNK